MDKILNKATGRLVTPSNETFSEGKGDFSAYLPAVAVGADKVFLDMFASGTNLLVTVHKIIPVVDGSVAVTGTVAVNMTANKTSAVGTGGTAITPTKLDSQTTNLDAGVTIRSAPSGGATLVAGAVYGFASLLTEETSAGMESNENLLQAPVVLRHNEGIAVKQGSVASVGNIAFLVVFSVADKRR